MRKFDLETYNRTKDLPGGPIFSMVEAEFAEIEPFQDSYGVPTKGGQIGYHIASVLLLGLFLYLYRAI